MKPIVIIFGYNNTRVFDVKKIGELAKELFNASFVLCKDEITPEDIALTEYTLAIPLAFNDEKVLNQNTIILDEFLAKNHLRPIGCLPFSDRGVVMGSYYAKSKNLKYDDPKKGCGGIDKAIFREMEKTTQMPKWYKKPLFEKVNSYQQAEKIILNSEIKLFIKPTCEGNSRGCFAISNINDLHSYKDNLEKYWSEGVIIEECIQDCHEYSFESIDDFQIITEKKTTEGSFKVEIQHVLPAPLPMAAYSRLIIAGMEVGKIVGSSNGAQHNELFLHNSGNVYCVEPNRRPAGMKIWDMIKVAFDFDMYKAWLNWACGGDVVTSYPVQNKYFVGYRMLRSKKSGILEGCKVEVPVDLQECIVEFEITKKIGSKVTNILKDNSDGIGYAIVKHEDINQLYLLLDKIETHIISNIQILES